MLGGDARSGTVRAAKDNGRTHLATGHVERLGRRIDDLVNRLHGKVERHELDDRFEPGHRSTNADAGETMLGNRRVDDPFGTEFVQQPLRHLVGALIFGDLLTHDEDITVAAHLLGHCVTKRFADRGGNHLRAFGDLRIGSSLRLGGCRRFVAFGWRFAGVATALRLGLRSFALCLSIASGLGGSGLDVVGAFAFFQQDGYGRVYLDALGARLDENFADPPLVHGLDFHCRLVGFDLGDHVA